MLSWVIFHLKLSLRIVAIYGAYKWSKFFIYPPGEISFSSPCSYQSNLLFSVCGGISPHNFGMFSISPLQAYSFRCWFSNHSVITFLAGCFTSSFVVEVGIFFSILLFQWSIFYSFFRRHCDVALFNPSSCFVKIMFNSFHLQSECCPNYIILIPSLSCFNRNVVSSAQVLFALSSLASLSTGVLSEFVLPRSSFLTECFQLRSSPLCSFLEMA